jgi:tetratricopeptide (TPR) repeat protein
MTPLFYGVYHGCSAGKYDESLAIFFGRILRGEEHYLVTNLGAFGTDLALLANFFTSPWTVPVPDLSSPLRARVINSAAFALRALGRLEDAVEPMKAGAQADLRMEDWQNATSAYGNLGELQLTIGDVSETIVTARKTVELADRSGDGFLRIIERTNLADALHQQGSVAEARHQFEEAESLQEHYDPYRQILFSVRGYQYCDLLMDERRTDEVLRRAKRTIGWSTRPLSIGLDHLSLGRAYPRGSAESVQHLDHAVEYLRHAGTLHHLPRALLARGTQHDLDEVYAIASRSGMRLHLTDYHLAQARLDLREGRTEKARGHADQAAKLIEQTGYHRRDTELAELQRNLAANPA